MDALVRLRFAYADPPYPGLSNYYDGMGQAEEVDYVKLIDRLWAEFDGWAVSLHAPALRDILPRIDPKVRIGAWCKPWTRFKRNIRVQYAWEPVLFWTPRNAPPKRGEKWGEDAAVRDWCAVNASMKTVLVNGKKFKGVKPPDFCRWVFALLGAKPGDEFHDLFPGSGAVSEAWATYQANAALTGGEAVPSNGVVGRRDR